MAGFVSKGNHLYEFEFKLAVGHADIDNGMFVALNYTDKTCATPTANTVLAYFVENVIDTVDEEQIDDINFKISAGSYVRCKRLVQGEEFITTKVSGTAPAVNDIVDVGTTGCITKTSGSPAQTFQVVEKPTLFGVTAYRCIALN